MRSTCIHVWSAGDGIVDGGCTGRNDNAGCRHGGNSPEGVVIKAVTLDGDLKT